MKKYKTCKDAFKSIGLQYDNYLYKCYNEEITPGTKLCPFAEKDTCQSAKLLTDNACNKIRAKMINAYTGLKNARKLLIVERDYI